jgi:hypothetical protein
MPSCERLLDGWMPGGFRASPGKGIADFGLELDEMGE